MGRERELNQKKKGRLQNYFHCKTGSLKKGGSRVMTNARLAQVDIDIKVSKHVGWRHDP